MQGRENIFVCKIFAGGQEGLGTTKQGYSDVQVIYHNNVIEL